MTRFLLVLIVLLVAGGCSRERRYQLEGQVLAVDRDKGELTVRHEDIKGFMPGMTMPFKVSDPTALAERKPGDLIRATLVVSDSTGHLEDVIRTGEAPLPADVPAARSSILEPGATAPDVELVDQEGRTRSLADWRGRPVAVTFVYTRCPLPDFCPLIDRHFLAVQQALSTDQQLAGRVHLLSVSFDPEYDRPEVLRAHAERLGADPAIWTWLTGDREAIDRFAGAFGVSILRDDRPMPEIIHNLRTVVLDAEGRVTKILSGNNWKPEELVEALRAADGR